MLNSVTESTLKQYEKPLKLWWTYSREKGTSLYKPEISDVLQFFTDQLQTVKSFSTINTHRAALSFIMPNRLGENTDVHRFFQGIKKKMPTNSKYSYFWDPKVVLDYLTNLRPNDELALDILSKKLITLLALTTAQRVQTLAAIKLSNIAISQEKVLIKISDEIKTSKHMKSKPVLDLPFFTSNPSICPASTLVTYIIKTADLRPKNEDQLLITFKKPHHAATRNTISRWIKDTLGDSGIDISMYGAHSTRGASTSAAAQTGANIETIRNAAGWSENSSTFANFYNRPIRQEQFANFVLNRE